MKNQNDVILGPVTQQQYEALELFITHSLKVTIRAKKAILWFLRQSNYLQKDLAMTIPYKENGGKDHRFAAEIAYGIHDMNASGHHPNTYEMLTLIDCPKHLSSHCGIAKKIDDKLIQFETGWDGANQESIPLEYEGYTVWISKEWYSRKVELIEFNEKEIQMTKLRKNYFESSSSGSTTYHDPEFYEEHTIPKEFYNIGQRLPGFQKEKKRWKWLGFNLIHKWFPKLQFFSFF